MAQKIALITGGNRGIGNEIARQLYAKGLKIYLSARNLEKAELAAREISTSLPMGGKIFPIEIDVTANESIIQAAAEIQGKEGYLDILVNNAGIFLKNDTQLMDLSEDVLNRTLQTNLFGAWRCIKSFVPLLMNSNSGRIINVSSMMGSLRNMGPGHAAYRISKTALNALTRILHSELASKGIAVNSMCPGWVQTDMGGSGAPKSIPEGADTAVFLALELPQNESGRFYQDRKTYDW